MHATRASQFLQQRPGVQGEETSALPWAAFGVRSYGWVPRAALGGPQQRALGVINMPVEKLQPPLCMREHTQDACA